MCVRVCVCVCVWQVGRDVGGRGVGGGGSVGGEGKEIFDEKNLLKSHKKKTLSMDG